MTLMANSKVSLLTGLDSTKNQPSISTPVVGGSSTFLQTLNNTASELPNQTDFEGLVSSTHLALETAVLVLDDASVKASSPIDDSTKENLVAPIADAVWLAHWFQNNSPATVSLPVSLIASGSDPVEPAPMESAPVPLAMVSSEPSPRAEAPISEISQQYPRVLTDKPVYGGSHPPAAALSKASASLSLPSSLVVQTTTQPAAPSTSKGWGFLDNKSSKKLSTVSGNLIPTEVRSKVPMDIGGSVKSGQDVGFKDFKDIENSRWLPVMPVSAQVRLDPQVGQNLPHQMVGAESAPIGLGPDVQWALNLAGTANQVVDQGLPLWVPAQSSPPATVTSPLVLPVLDKPSNALANAPVAKPLNVSTSLPLPTSFAVQSTFQLAAQSPAQSASRSASMDLGVLDNQSPENLPSNRGNLIPTEVHSKVPMDSGGSVKLGQAVGFKDFNDLENGRGLPVTAGSVQVRQDPQVGQNLPQQKVGKEAAAPDLNPDVQWTSNLTGTVNKWVEPGSPLPVSVQSRTAATDSSTTPLPVSVLDLREPALMRTESKPLGTFPSEISSRIDVPASEIPKQIPTALPDKPVNALASVPAAFPSNVVASLSLPTSLAIQATSQPVSIEVVILDKKSPKNLSIDIDRLKSTEVLSKVPMDMGGSVTWAQSVGFKESKGFENDRSIPVMSVSGAGLVSLDSYSGQNLPHQTVGTDAAPSGFSPDAQWTSNLADTVNQWVEQSLQLADLTIPDAGQDSLQVRIELKGQEATVYFLTDHDQYRSAIESQIENLSDRLADQGLKLAGSFVGQGNSQNSPQQQSAHSMLSRRPESEPASTRGVPVDPVLRDMKSVPNGRVLDVFA